MAPQKKALKVKARKFPVHACNTERHFERSCVRPRAKETKHTCGICEPEGDGLVFDVAHVADGHLARVVGEVFGSEVLDLQHLGLTLRDRSRQTIQ